MKRLIQLFVVTITLCAVFTIAGCDNAGNSNNVKIGQTTGNVVDYGNGVFYFKSTEDVFANNLSAFIAGHPDLLLVSIAGNGTGVHGADNGYFVIFRKK